MIYSKSEFFDAQVQTDWASGDYTSVDSNKIHKMLDLALIREGSKILEPGCGTGRLTRILADRVGSNGEVLAVDISPKMIEACLRNVAQRANVEAVCAAVEDYPLPPGAFDAVVCHQVFPHFDDKLQVLCLFAKILKPQGTLVIFHFINSSHINKMHREAHAVVESDLMPSEAIMREMFAFAGIRIDFLKDDEDGYLLISHMAD